ncbi:hypothetical protein [Serratia marcescens]|uniref:hypothetical protein n=1 Tax=Serratia marcescens TaxID=615 RepID=UPI001249DF51|nr:hypothetical protein [Serratia marcescens]KAB1578713.1 hypothetical protein F7687_22525 [Serratia marcescens]
MDKARDENLLTTAQEALNEYRSLTNNLTYREILDKHAAKIAPDWPAKPPAWMRLSSACMRIDSTKKQR